MGVYGWLITEDHIAEKGAKPGSHQNAIGITGPGGVSDDLTERLAAGEGRAFRMRDGDGKLYYTGRIIADPGSEDDFGPLDDFGIPNAGCAWIEYENAVGKWEML